MSQTLPIITDLVKKFERNIHEYRNPKYNETLIRVEFVNPFWKALGWDVDNEKGYSLNYRDVIHEDELKVGRTTRAPDYAFRVGGRRIFFLETKKPAVDLKHDPAAAFQLRRYAYSAKLPVSLLTDFEELIVYDCRIKPAITDKPHIGRMMYYTFQEYIEKWEEISDIFSKEAVMQGAFDRFIEDTQGKRPRAEIDRDFLNDLDKWRIELARNIALRNPELTERELNYAVQLTIDRLIFLRMCEDRDIEQYETLMTLLNGNQIYRRLVKLYYKADHRYNSGLFHFEEKDGPNPDILTPKLEVDDKILKQIISELYYPKCPYEFSVLPVEVLGNAYEQFLGKRITLTEGHRARIEEKPEVRKAGGVYYTPQYIVDYIVKNTVGKLCESKTPREVSELRILDPACGSGSFLLGAYQYLLDWHVNWYRAEYERTGHVPQIAPVPTKKKKRKTASQAIFQGKGGEWFLTTAEKKRILTNNIYGVDIDANAVEVTKLSLLLKVLEHETSETLNQQLGLWKERALPNLESNIKCGNSLIGTDFYEGQQAGLFNEEEALRINAFDWEREFAEIFAKGGFDAVIGNPPWGAEFSESELVYHRKKFQEIIVRMIDSFMYFIYRGFNLLKSKGSFGMILPDVILYQKDNEKLRDYILTNFRIDAILNMGDVFEKVTRPTAILILEKSKVLQHSILVADFSKEKKIEKKLSINNIERFINLEQETILEIPGSLFITENSAKYEIWKKVKSVPNVLLKNLTDEDGIQRGVSPDLKEAFIVNSSIIKKWGIEKEKIRKVLTGGKEVKRYHINRPDLWVIYTKSKDDFRKFPNIRAYIDQFKNQITCSEVKTNKHPIYSLHRPRNENIFLKSEKIIGVITEDEIVVALDKDMTFATDGLYLFSLREGFNSKYLMAILNSKLFVFVYRLISLEKGRVLAQVKPTTIGELPIRSINQSDPAEIDYYKRVVSLVDQMLSLHEKFAAANTSHEKTVLQRQIDATDRQIDQFVYQLYGLTEEEIRIVEGNV